MHLISNMEIIDRLSAMAEERNTSLTDVLEYTELADLAHQCGFPWYEAPGPEGSIPTDKPTLNTFSERQGAA